MSHPDLQTLVNFIHTQSPATVYLIPSEDAHGHEVDPTNAEQIGELLRGGGLRQIQFSEMDLSDFSGADEQQDAGGLIVDAGTAHYLIGYAPMPVPSSTPEISAAARHVRDLFGPEASTIVTKYKLTDDAPRSLIAYGLRVSDAAGHELAVPWTAFAELAINEHDEQDEPCLHLDGEVVPLGSPEVYAAALQANPTLIMGINDLLLDADTPFELVQALNNLGQATGWTRMDLPPVQDSATDDTLREEVEEQLRLVLQAQLSDLDPARVQQIAPHVLRSILSGLGPQGQQAGALRRAYGLDPA